MSNSNDKVLAQPPGDCCLNYFSHTGEPKGKFQQIGEFNTYVSTPPSKDGKRYDRVLLYFPDVWGIHAFKNGQLLVDYFASQGYLSLAPDYFRGDSVTMHRKDRHDTTTDPYFDYEAWKAKHMSFCTSHLPSWVDVVAREFGGEGVKVFCVGYCFGAPFVMSELAKSDPEAVVTAGAFAHPAFLTEQHFVDCRRPLLLSCAETDHTFPLSSLHKAIEILKSSSHTPKPAYQLQLFSGVEHGFALRGDMEDPYQRYVKEESAAGIVRWFNHFCFVSAPR